MASPPIGVGMNRRGLIGVFRSIALVAELGSVPAAADGKCVALVIGNGAYSGVPTLPNP